MNIAIFQPVERKKFIKDYFYNARTSSVEVIAIIGMKRLLDFIVERKIYFQIKKELWWL